MHDDFGGYFDAPLRRGIIKVIILRNISKSTAYPYGMLKRMHDMRSPLLAGMAKGDLYNIFASLENDGFVTKRAGRRAGRATCMYALTPMGRRAVSASSKLMHKYLVEVKQLVKSEFSE